jgi:hypothetical protein
MIWLTLQDAYELLPGTMGVGSRYPHQMVVAGDIPTFAAPRARRAWRQSALEELEVRPIERDTIIVAYLAGEAQEEISDGASVPPAGSPS